MRNLLCVSRCVPPVRVRRLAGTHNRHSAPTDLLPGASGALPRPLRVTHRNPEDNPLTRRGGVRGCDRWGAAGAPRPAESGNRRSSRTSMQPETERATGAAQGGNAQGGDASGFAGWACPRCPVECVRRCRQECVRLVMVPAAIAAQSQAAEPCTGKAGRQRGRIAAGMRGVFIQEAVLY